MDKDKLFLKIVSLLIAILMFFSVNDNLLSNFFEQGKSSNYTTTWIRSVPIEVNYDKNKYYILGIPDSVDVKITGPTAKVQKESVDRSFKARIDFSKIDVGDNQKLKVEIVELNNGLEAVSNPEFITVSVRNKISREYQVKPTVKNERLLLGYSLKSVSVTDQTIKISGAEESLDNIYEVRAESTEKTKISSNIKEEAKLVAYDRNFNKIEDIEMEKTTTTISINVEAIEKTIPITINQIGELPSDYELVSITVEPNSAKIRAENKDILTNIEEAFVDVELTDIKQETKELSNLKIYANTSSLYTFDVATVKVTIKVKKK
ncbi:MULTISPECIES: YbbR-like domain-containing protein [unclassified Gemella]|uniref:CdaR family protein n=1 Tax=unclassified Gemella TaxID=2624949 RepID=UPI001C05087C|nr:MULTISPECIES: CdaR family protein [unclassified Gemella]MBU0278195.1 hypothetical protein [Gemella sp. zg-1178]QWQ38848.1 hypothetical protein KMP11_00330 [Gemella sp. zg-570]